MDFSTTLAAVRSMDLNDRIRLVQAIWDEIAADQAGSSACGSGFSQSA